MEFPRPLWEDLMELPTIVKGHTDDLKFELSLPNGQFRYWVSRLRLHDRPQPSPTTYEGGYPRITVEAYIDNTWVIICGYQGNLV